MIGARTPVVSAIPLASGSIDSRSDVVCSRTRLVRSRHEAHEGKVLRIGTPTLLTITAAVLLVPACADGTRQTGSSETGASCRSRAHRVEVTAIGISFDQDCLAVPAGRPFKIEFTNGDAGIPHNLAIYSNPSASEVLFRGDQFRGPSTTTYRVPQLPEGTLFFRCDVHPSQMTGTFIAG